MLGSQPEPLGERNLPQALAALGEVLAARGLRYEVVAIGGSALVLLGYIRRATQDLDLVALISDGKLVSAVPIPAPLAEAAADVARALRLQPAWLNPGPASLLELGLPEGFAERLQTTTFGGLTVHLAGRLDQIAFKLYAAVDQGPGSKHTRDLAELAPTRQELLAAARWTRTHDPSEGFRAHLIEALAHFGVRADDDI